MTIIINFTTFFNERLYYICLHLLLYGLWIFFFWPYHEICGMLVLLWDKGSDSTSPAVGMQNLNHRKPPVHWSCSVELDSAIPWIIAYQFPPPMEFSRQEYWSRLPFPRKSLIMQFLLKLCNLTFPQNFILKGYWWEPCVTLGVVTSGGENFDLGSEMRLEYLELIV